MGNQEVKTSSHLRISAIGLALVLLFLVYLFQHFNYAGLFFNIIGEDSNALNTRFIINRSIRLIINDSLCMVLIFGLFLNKSYLKLASLVFLFELLLLLPIYLWLKLTLEGPSEISSPLLSPIHRMIVNPLLMIILIAALYYQQYVLSSRK